MEGCVGGCVPNTVSLSIISIQGAEQFSTYKGYGYTLEFGGEYEDKSEVCGKGTQ